MQAFRKQAAVFGAIGLAFTLLHWAAPAGANPAELGPTIQVASGSDPDVAVDRAGNLHVVYVRSGSTYYRRISAPYPTGAIGPEFLVGSGANPKIALDSHGNPHVAFGTGHYARWIGSGFSARVQAMSGWRKNMIAVDSLDRVYVMADIRTPRQVALRVYQNGTAISSLVKIGDDNNGGAAVDAADTLHATTRPKRNIVHSAYRLNGGSLNKLTLHGGASDFSYIAVQPSNQSLHIVNTVAHSNGIHYTWRPAAGAWSPVVTYAATEAKTADGDFVNPTIAADREGYKYVTFRGRNEDGYYFVLDGNQQLVGGIRFLDPENRTKAGGKMTNPNSFSAPYLTGAFVAWGVGTVYVRGIGVSDAYLPEGWVHMGWPYAYDAGEGGWFSLSSSDATRWCVNLETGDWSPVETSALAEGWSWFAWPFAYHGDSGDWHYILEDDIPWWVFDFGLGRWRRLVR